MRKGGGDDVYVRSVLSGCIAGTMVYLHTGLDDTGAALSTHNKERISFFHGSKVVA